MAGDRFFHGSTLEFCGQWRPCRPRGDHLVNLAKYALGLNPWIPAAPPIGVSLSGSYLHLTFPRMKIATDVTYHVQGSPDLFNWLDVWTSGTNAYTGGTNAAVFVTVPDSVRESSANSRFMRLVISKP